MLEAARVDEVPVFNRVVVAVDPPVTSMKSSDACGIVVVGADTRGEPQDWKAVVLEDASVKGATRLCCTNRVRDSSRESNVVAAGHEQTHAPRLQDPELA
jgi:phage terminase large subunit-like protein